jgi:hypothetical protein
MKFSLSFGFGIGIGFGIGMQPLSVSVSVAFWPISISVVHYFLAAFTSILKARLN